MDPLSLGRKQCATMARARFNFTSKPTLMMMLSLFAMLNLGCAKGDQGDGYTPTPHLDFECAFVDAQGCSPLSSGKFVFIGLHHDTSIDCSTQIEIANGDHFGYSFDYSSQTQATLQNGVLAGVATEWINSHLMPVETLPKQSYRVCAYVDLNNNRTRETNEPILQSLIETGADFLPFSDWSNN